MREQSSCTLSFYTLPPEERQPASLAYREKCEGYIFKSSDKAHEVL